MLKLIKRYKMFLIVAGLIVSNIVCFAYKEVQKEKITLQEVSLEDETSEMLEKEQTEPSRLDAVNSQTLGKEPILEEDLQVQPQSSGLAQPITVPIHVCGAVAVPGVYYLENTAIVQDVITLCGGFTPEADQSALNLARPIKAYEKIYIPKVGEEIDKSADSYDNKEADIVMQQGSASTSQTQISDNVRAQEALININTASISELTTLSGIGEAKAKAIIAYRETVARFGSIEEIKNVSGIGEKTFEKIKACITV